MDSLLKQFYFYHAFILLAFKEITHYKKLPTNVFLLIICATPDSKTFVVLIELLSTVRMHDVRRVLPVQITFL